MLEIFFHYFIIINIDNINTYVYESLDKKYEEVI